MSLLTEIEAATETLSAPEKEALFRFLAARLRVPLAPTLQPCKTGSGKGFAVAAHRDWLKRKWGERRFTEDEVREMRAAQERGRPLRWSD